MLAGLSHLSGLFSASKIFERKITRKEYRQWTKLFELGGAKKNPWIWAAINYFVKLNRSIERQSRQPYATVDYINQSGTNNLASIVSLVVPETDECSGFRVLL